MNTLTRVLAALMLAAAVQACAPQGTEGAKLASGQKLQISQTVWDDYQDYIKYGRGLGPDRDGAFGVAVVDEIGLVGLYSYTYCPRQYDGCRPGGTNALTDVLDACRRESVECVIFARNEEILVPYEIAD